MELARRRIERERDLVPVTCALGRLEDRLARLVGGAEVRGEATLIADRRRETALAEKLLQVVVALRADAERLGEARRTRRERA